MTFIEHCLIKHTLMSWFNRKIKSKHFQIDISTKNKYEKKNTIKWASNKCNLKP